MPNLIVGGVLATAIVIIIGTLYAAPPYLAWVESSQRVPTVILSLSITSDQDMPQWCEDAADYLNNNRIDAVVYFSGEVADRYPDCVRSFHTGVELGSSTYSFKKLSSDRDYLEQLEDVRMGKFAIDSIAGIDSKVFKAPFGYTDDNIYSFLSRNDIIADFSKTGSYNGYDGKNFIFHDLQTFAIGIDSDDVILSRLEKKTISAVQLSADNSIPIAKITSLIDETIAKHRTNFVNASEITGLRVNLEREL